MGLASYSGTLNYLNGHGHEESGAVIFIKIQKTHTNSCFCKISMQ